MALYNRMLYFANTINIRQLLEVILNESMCGEGKGSEERE
jgi:hypothetical protein